MPSIPQSLLWISLVVLWLFVLVPMLISKRDAVRRTSDVALATRVLNTSRAAGCSGVRGPAAGHRSDPDWRPSDDDLDEARRGRCTTPSKRGRCSAQRSGGGGRGQRVRHRTTPNPTTSTWTSSRRTPARCRSANRPRRGRPRESEDDADAESEEPEAHEENVDTAMYEIDDRRIDEEHRTTSRTVPTTSTSTSTTPRAWRRRRKAICRWPSRWRPRADAATNPAKAAAVSARKYKFRKRMLALMALVLVASAAAAFALTPVGVVGVRFGSAR